MSYLNLVDIWREIKPQTPGYTWRRHNPYKLAERLDYILIADSLAQLVNGMLVHPMVKTDHDVVQIDFALDFQKRGPGYWKMNTKLLQDKDYLEKINKLLDIELEQKELYKSKKDHWEIIKLMIRGTTLQYSARKKKATDNLVEVLEKKLAFWIKQSDDTFFVRVKERTDELCKQIDNINAENVAR